MKKTNVLTASLLLVCLAGTMVAHPHFNKTVTASVKGLELKLTYFTLPYNANIWKESRKDLFSIADEPS